MNLDELAEEVERRVKAELATIYRPSGNDETAAWKKHIIDVFSEWWGRPETSPR